MSNFLQQLRRLPDAALGRAAEIVERHYSSRHPEDPGRVAALTVEIAAALSSPPGAPTYQELYRWAYAMLVDLAKIQLEAERSEAEPGEWPWQLEWEGLGSTSRSGLLHRVREHLSIDHGRFLAPIRADAVEVDDLHDGEGLVPEAPLLLDAVDLVASLEWSSNLGVRCPSCDASRPRLDFLAAHGDEVDQAALLAEREEQENGGHERGCALRSLLVRARGQTA